VPSRKIQRKKIIAEAGAFKLQRDHCEPLDPNSLNFISNSSFRLFTAHTNGIKSYLLNQQVAPAKKIEQRFKSSANTAMVKMSKDKLLYCSLIRELEFPITKHH
jgi:6-phosphogluconolactonase (cycloisomerase 2 family)